MRVDARRAPTKAVGFLCLSLAQAILAWVPVSAHAFALIGPYSDWMQPDIGYRYVGDIGGPMDLDEGYRWNVPVVSYGYDETFIDYFGSNGVLAVESAIAEVNGVPAASQIVLTNYPLHVLHFNPAAQGLMDLKTAALGSLVENLGLAQPIRYVFALRRLDAPFFLAYPDEGLWPTGTIPNLVLVRNFDPETLVPSHAVNGQWFTTTIILDYFRTSAVPTQILMDPDGIYDDVAAQAVGFNQFDGAFISGLSQDDVGGLRWLLRSDNINYETLQRDVHEVDTISTNFVSGGWRPGVEKITLVRHPYWDWLHFYWPLVTDFTGTYLTNGVLRRQHLERVTPQPDILFCAGDTGTGSPSTPCVLRTGTAGWQNNSAQNWSDPAKLGPGVIQPPVRITFHLLGPEVTTVEGNPTVSLGVTPYSWGSFDDSTNAPIVYPGADSKLSNQLTMRLRVYGFHAQAEQWHYDWHLPVPTGGHAALEVSTNLVNWISLQTVTNAGSVIEWDHHRDGRSTCFFRAVAE